ncbi:hypothetical protein GO013_09040 [Pseudodesulfovibrio sp. JC047]|uniref:SemiSWEET family sugar transporter n=1 Tax=Pseudodesulfovibrio sp. JC047 TaxID=2683199 RepID=UPI0013D1CEEF|nr:SemiSWEET transporter [Pseudodesulfovibrio sp. JC047]NDV19562.1 hypothetical protein [Pseudodesulfovibrio sp. JC047]
MNITPIEIVGLIAGFCTTFSFLPQVIKTWRTRSVDDISLRMYLLLCFGIVLWLYYGLTMRSVALVLTNGVSFILTASILVMKLLFGKRR